MIVRRPPTPTSVDDPTAAGAPGVAGAAPAVRTGPSSPALVERVTVVMITWNRAAEIVRTLDLLDGLAEAVGVIVVDNGSTDDTVDRVRAAHPAVRVVRAGRNLGAGGRNLGVALATTPYVAFCDDDTWWSPGSLTRAADLLDAHDRLAVLTAHIVVEPDGVDDLICAELRASPLDRPADAPGHPLLSFLAGASMIRRRAFVGVGGFGHRVFFGGEEEHLAVALAAAGWAMAHVPEVVIHHQASRVRDADVRRAQGIRNTLWFAWLHRPPRPAVRRTLAMARRVPVDRVSAGAFLRAAGGLGWVLAERRVVPPDVEAGLALLDAGQLDSGNRRYVSED